MQIFFPPVWDCGSCRHQISLSHYLQSQVAYLTPFSSLHTVNHAFQARERVSNHAIGTTVGRGGWHNGSLPTVTLKLNLSKKGVGKGRCPRQRTTWAKCWSEPVPVGLWPPCSIINLWSWGLTKPSRLQTYRVQNAWVPDMALLLTGCIILDNLLGLSKP